MLNWIKCLFKGHDYKVRYVPLKSVSELNGETLFPPYMSSVRGAVIPVNQCKRRAIICERCGKELKVK